MAKKRTPQVPGGNPPAAPDPTDPVLPDQPPEPPTDDGEGAEPEQPKPEAPKAKVKAQPKQSEISGSEGGHLRAADVDPTKLKRAVLTADGWVCPETSPAPPARQ